MALGFLLLRSPCCSRCPPRRPPECGDRTGGVPPAPPRRAAGPLISAVGVSFILQNVALTIAGTGATGARAQIFPLSWRVLLGGASISLLSFVIFADRPGSHAQSADLRPPNADGARDARHGPGPERLHAHGRRPEPDDRDDVPDRRHPGRRRPASVGLRFGFVRRISASMPGLKAVNAGRARRDRQHHRCGPRPDASSASSRTSRPRSAKRAGQEFIVFMVLTLVLLFRPAGILGQQSGDRA